MRLREIITKNWALKLISLSFAIILWFFVVGEEKAEVGITLPLVIVNIPPNLTVANEFPSNIKVKVYGPRSMVRALASQHPSKVIDLKDATAGIHIIRLSATNLPIPSSIRVISIQPSVIKLVLSPIITKLLTVKPIIVGRPALGYKIESIKVIPSKVAVSGPKNELKKIKYVKTLPINIDRASSTVINKVELNLDKPHCDISDSEKEVTVIIKIVPKIETLKISHVPVTITPPNSAITCWPDIVSLILEGPTNKLHSLSMNSIKVEVPSNIIKPGTQYIIPKVKVPKGIIVKEIIPDKIKITVKNKPLIRQK